MMNERNPHILVVDGYNFIHRARGGFTKGEFSVVFNFMRGLRALVEQHRPSRVYFVIEGHPRARHAMMEDYKANRIVDPEREPEKHEELTQFHRQKLICIGLLKTYFPISVIRHPYHECDDVIFNLINRSSRAVPWTVVSNDTDFIQLLQEFPNVRLYNPMKKEYVEAPEYDYVTWKALRGDGSDNITGVAGIGDKRAEALARDLDGLAVRLRGDDAMFKTFMRNTEMIRFIRWDDEESLQMRSYQTDEKIWDHLAIAFKTMGFNSLLNEKTWKKFVETFDPLWSEEDGD